MKNYYRTIMSMIVLIASIQFIFTESSIPTADGFTLEVSGSSVVDFKNYVNSSNSNDLSISTIPPSSGEILNTVYGGTLEPLGNLLYNYTPPEGYPADFILFKVNDGQAQSDLAFGTFSLNDGLFSSSSPPSAFDDNVYMPEDNEYWITFVGMDVAFPFSGDESVQITQQPANGSLSTPEQLETNTPLLAQWNAMYTPGPDFNGTDNIKFTVTNPENPNSTSNEATITITILAVNDAPEITSLPDGNVVNGYNWTPGMYGGTIVVDPSVSQYVFRKDTGNDVTWDGIVYSEESSIYATAAMQVVGSGTEHFMFGLDESGTGHTQWGTGSYYWFLQTDGSLDIRINGSTYQEDPSSTFAQGDIFSVEADGAEVKFYHNGTLKYTHEQFTGSDPLHLLANFRQVDGSMHADLSYGDTDNVNVDIEIGDTFSYQVTADDVDNDYEDLTFSIADALDGMTISNTELIDWTPPDSVGTFGPITVAVSDGGLEDSQSFTISTYFLDCAGTVNGQAVEDMCNVCDADPENDCVQDCAGDWGGSAYLDNCETCDTDSENDCVQDCAGTWGGTADYDECNVCGGLDNNEDGQCSCSNYSDCSSLSGDQFCTSNGVCDVFSGQYCDSTTCGDGDGDCDATNQCAEGLYCDQSLNNCGIYDGHNPSSQSDCCCMPDTPGCCMTDNCGVCDLWPANDCIQDCAGTWGGTAWNSDCGCVSADNSGDDCDDCAGVPNGSADYENYYTDLDGDGLGAGESSSYCNATVPGGWVQNNDDPEPECATNNTDVCGVCDGDGFDCDGDGLGSCDDAYSNYNSIFNENTFENTRGCYDDGWEDNDCDGNCDCCTYSNNEECNDGGCWWVENDDYQDGACLTESEANDGGGSPQCTCYGAEGCELYDEEEHCLADPNGCQWEECDNGPSDCLLNCENIEGIDDAFANFDADGICDIVFSWAGTGCYDECPPEEMVEEILNDCIECLSGAYDCMDLFGDPNPCDQDDYNINVCTDNDGDGCDDCSLGYGYDPNQDGLDSDSDGLCDIGDELPNCTSNILDDCGVCDGNNSPNTGICDCNSVPDGDAELTDYWPDEDGDGLGFGTESEFSLGFDGNEDYVTLPIQRESLGVNYTMSAWIKYDGTTNASYQAVFGGQSANFFIGKDAGNTKIGVQDGQYDSNHGGDAAWNGDWHNIAVVRNGATINAYVDGIQISNKSYSGTGSGQIFLGLENQGNPRFAFTGLMDDVAIWNISKSQNEVSEEWNTELTGSEPGLVAHYNFNESSGNILNDLSENGNDGTIYGATWIENQNGGGGFTTFCDATVTDDWADNNDDTDDECFSNVHDCSEVCDGDAVMQDYYLDIDWDGLGAGDSVSFCNANIPSGWVANNSDTEPDCETNDTDDCGVCAGDNTSCADCAGTPNGDSWVSDCGCVAVDSSGDDCDDCNGVPNGDAVEQDYYFDSDGDGLGSGDSSIYCNANIPSGWVANNSDTEPDCETNDTDECGVCAGDNSPNTGLCDCNGVPDGDAELTDYWPDADGDGLGLGTGYDFGLSFNGVDDYVDVGSNVAPINDFTIEFWFSPENTHEIDSESTSGTVGTSGQHYAFGGHVNGGTAGAAISIGTNGVSVYEHASWYMPALLVWEGELTGMTHLTVTYENKQPKLYINGVFQKAGLTSPKDFVHAGLGSDGWIGDMNWYDGFEGFIDEVKVWDYTKLESEISNSWSSLSDGSESGLLAYWNFNEASGSIASDLTANGNDGTIHGATWIEGGSTTFCDATVSSNWVLNSDDLDDNCAEGIPIDCAGNCDGTLVVDECGICGGDGIPDDECDCDGNVNDECGECGGSGPLENFDCEGNCIVEIDCADVCGGDTVVDECGECGGSGVDSNNCCLDGQSPAGEAADCSGECGGTLVTDNCEVCGGDNSTCTDCAGIPNGTNWMTDCGCVPGGYTGDECDDCAGVPHGDAQEQTYYYDNDGDGVGAGEPSTYCDATVPEGWVLVDGDPQPDCITDDNDLCGVCAGDNSTCEDCAGVPNGTAQLITHWPDLDGDGFGDPGYPLGDAAYYPFDGDANDYSGNGYNGSPVGTFFTEDRYGYANSAIGIDSKSDRVDIPDFNSTNISVSMWYKYDGNGNSWNTLLCRQGGSYHHLLINKDSQEIAEKKNDNQGLASIYNVLSILYKSQGKYVKSNEHIEKALEIQLTLNNKLKEAAFRTNYASGLNYLNKLELAIEQNKKAILIKESLEEIHLMGSSYGAMTNTYMTIGDYSQALEYGIKALGTFRQTEMVNFEARILALIADIHMLIGDYAKMNGYMEEAKLILDDFNEPFLMGKLEFMQARNSLQNGDYESAIKHIDNCIDLFEISEQKHFIIDSYIEKQIILITKGENDKASKLISKIEMIKNKIDNPPIDRPIINILKLYLENKNIEEEFDFEKFSGDFQTDLQLSYWYTAKYFSLNNQIDKAKIYQEKAIENINRSAEVISNKKERAIFLNNEYYNKLIQEEIITESPEDKDKKTLEDAPPSVFAFCPSCGFNNESSFAFCPSCGNDLKQ